MSRRAKAVWIVLNVVALLLIAQASVSARNAAEASDARLKELQAQRLNLLRDISKQVTQMQQHGASSKFEVLTARRAVLAAEAEAAETKEIRVSLLEKLVELQKQIRDAMGQVQDTSAIEKMHLQIDVINSEITLERAKLGREIR